MKMTFLWISSIFLCSLIGINILVHYYFVFFKKKDSKKNILEITAIILKNEFNFKINIKIKNEYKYLWINSYFKRFKYFSKKESKSAQYQRTRLMSKFNLSTYHMGKFSSKQKDSFSIYANLFFLYSFILRLKSKGIKFFFVSKTLTNFFYMFFYSNMWIFFFLFIYKNQHNMPLLNYNFYSMIIMLLIWPLINFIKCQYVWKEIKKNKNLFDKFINMNNIKKLILLKIMIPHYEHIPYSIWDYMYF